MTDGEHLRMQAPASTEPLSPAAVGLFLTTLKYEARLGELTTGMLRTMTDRGPDSAGFAVYSSGDCASPIKMKLRANGSTQLHKSVSEIETIGSRQSMRNRLS